MNDYVSISLQSAAWNSVIKQWIKGKVHPEIQQIYLCLKIKMG